MIYTTDILGDQWEIFFGSLMLGLLLGGCYDAVRCLRVIFSAGKKALIATDVAFCAWAGFLIFSFLLEKNFGIPRFYIYIGIAAGFSAWYFTAGKLTMYVAKLLRRLLSTVKRVIIKPVLKILGKVLGFLGKKSRRFENILAKRLSSGKKLLKKKGSKVYNNLCLNSKKVFPFCGGKTGKEPDSFESKGNEKEQESFASDRSYCLRSVSPLLDDSDPGKHSREKSGA